MFVGAEYKVCFLQNVYLRSSKVLMDYSEILTLLFRVEALSGRMSEWRKGAHFFSFCENLGDFKGIE